MKVTVGGNVVTGFYFVDADHVQGTSYQDTKVALVARNIDIKAEGTLDNGLVAGVDAKLQLDNDWNGNGGSYASFRQLFAYLEGGFGKFEIGGTDGAAYKMHYTSPWFVPGNGVDSPNIYNAALSPVSVTTFSLMATDSNKVSYFTPRLAGFQLGLSYTPDAATHWPRPNGYGISPKYTGSSPFIRDVFEAALNYAGTLGGVDVGVDGFYTTGKSSIDSTDPEEYGFGANLGYMGFTLGGAYKEAKDIQGSPIGMLAVTDAEQKTWTAGLSYGTGPWTVGVAYLHGKEDNYTIVGGNKENDSWQVGGGYNLGSGVDVGLDLQLNKIDTGTTSYDAKSGGLVLAVAF